MYNLYLVSNLAVWLQQINKLYLLLTNIILRSAVLRRTATDKFCLCLFFLCCQ